MYWTLLSALQCLVDGAIVEGPLEGPGNLILPGGAINQGLAAPAQAVGQGPGLHACRHAVISVTLCKEYHESPDIELRIPEGVEKNTHFVTKALALQRCMFPLMH